ncbi:MAG: LysR family transcriptional regulator [bacterium]
MDEFFDIRLRDLQMLERLAAAGSITEAARELGVPKATASRWLTQLEERVGVSLVRRTTRSFALTEHGREFLSRAREILNVASAAQLSANSDVPGGTLRVSVPIPMGRMLAGPVIVKFRKAMPSVRLEIKLQNERVDLIKDNIDVAIRGGSLDDSELMTRKLTAASMWLYTGVAFRGMPISEIPIIASPGDQRLLQMANITDATPAVVVDDRTAVADALVWGAGAGLLPSFLGEPPRKDGRLIRMDDKPLVALPIHAVYHHSQRDDPRIRVLVDTIERELEKMLEP